MNNNDRQEAMGINEFKNLLDNHPNKSEVLDKAVGILNEQMYDISFDFIQKIMNSQDDDDEASYRVYTYVEKLILEKYLDDVNKQLCLYQDPKIFSNNV